MLKSRPILLKKFDTSPTGSSEAVCEQCKIVNTRQKSGEITNFATKKPDLCLRQTLTP